MGGIRTAARALIVRRGQLLLNHYRDESGDWYTAPGGGQGVGEQLPQTLVRECREEIGVEVEVGRLRFVRDYIVADHDFSYLSEADHQVEFFFECTVPDDYVAQNGPDPDKNQVDVIWADAEALRVMRVYPARLGEAVEPAPDSAVYWGSGD